MKYLTGEDRWKIPLFVGCLKEAIDQDNEIRLIYNFANVLPSADFGLKADRVENNRPAYHPADLLKLHLYGYLNRMRSSSSQLEKKCKHNPEVRWLLKSLASGHNTIINFRKNDLEAIRKVFQAMAEPGKRFDLL